MSNSFRRHRSIFGPLLLIGLGAVLLAVNLGLLESVQLLNLVRLWPLVLVGMGINLLFQRQPWVGNLTALLIVGGAVLFLFYAPRLNLSTPGGEMLVEDFSEPLGAAQSAEVNLNIDRGALLVAGQVNPGSLFDARVEHNQRVTFEARGETDKSITLRLDAEPFEFFDFFSGAQISTTVGLAPGIPLDLDLNLGAGGGTLDLAALTLARLEASTGSGTLTLALPAGEYPSELRSGSGGLTVNVAPDAVLALSANVGSGRITLTLGEGVTGTVELDAGSGGIVVNVPAGVGVQITADTGSGGIDLPEGYLRISGADSPGPGNKGTWQSPGFESAQLRLYLDIHVGSGGVTVRVSE
jgi:hypothetical protein